MCGPLGNGSMSERAVQTVKQIVRASALAWLIVLVLAPILSWTLGVGFVGAAARACFFVAVIALGAGAASIAGGVTGARPLGPADLGFKPIPRAGVPNLSGPLTLLGTAIFVCPQLILIGGLLYD